MKILLYVLTIMLTCTSCMSKHLHDNAVPKKSVSTDLYHLHKQRNINSLEQFKRIDILLDSLFESKFEICHFHLSFSEGHDYSRMHNNVLDELVFYYTQSLEHEKYIFHKIMREYIGAYGTDNEDWYNCLMLLPKRDCNDTYLVNRLRKLPRILKDTTNVQNSIEIINKVVSAITEPCATTLKFISTEVKWREDLFNSLVMQIPHVIAHDEESLFYIHYVMHYLPDSLTTNFAYQYIMTTELSGDFNNLSWPLFDIITYRSKDWGIYYDMPCIHGYTDYKGPNILLSKKMNQDLIFRAQEIEQNRDCDWCEEFISHLKGDD